MVLKFINIPILVLSFIVGLVFSYITEPPKTVVYVYPTPENYKQIEYVDNVGNCFQFAPNKVKCPKDDTKIKVIPVQ